jgi:hypothetical protein
MRKVPVVKILGLAVFVLQLISLLSPVSANAQAGGGTILGTVADTSGARVPSAQLSIKSTTTGESRTVTTDSNGFYNAPSLGPGNYEITVTAAGFETLLEKDVVIVVGRELTLNLELKVGTVTQHVEVTSTVSQVELSNSTVTGSVDATTIRELPLNGRDWVQLTTLQAGVAPLRGANPVGQPAISPRLESGEGQQIALSGGRPEMLNFLLNGISIMDYANTSPGAATGLNLGVDSIQEFSVIVSTPPAGYGRTASGVVTAAVRPGTNAFHGSGIAFFRNSALDAKNYFDAIDASIPPFYRHQYGGSIGGPVKKDSTFFFFDYEALRQSLTQTSTGTTISEAARAGIFANGDVVPPSAFIQKYLGLFPTGSCAGGVGGSDTCPITLVGALNLTETYYIGRLDHKFGNSDNFDSSYFYDTGSQGSPGGLNTFVLGDITHRQAVTLEETHIFNSRLANSWRGGYTRTYASDTHVLSISNPALADPTLGSIPGLDMSTLGLGNVGLGPGQNAQDVTSFNFNTFQIYDDLIYTRGMHTLKLGGSFEFDLDNYDSPNQHSGVWNFNSLEDFYKGNPTSFGAQIPGLTTERNARQKIYGVYLQDDIRLRRNLTVNLGLRYERATSPTEAHGRLADLRNITDPVSTIGSLYIPSSLNFSPRIGFAWDPFGDGKTSVRAAFGIYDALPLLYELANRFNRGYPFYQQGLVNWCSAPTVANPCTPTFQPAPPGTFPGGGLTALQSVPSIVTVSVEHNPHRSYLTQWNLNVQRDLGHGLTAQLGYVGSRGTHLANGDYDVNTYVPQMTAQGPFWDPALPAQQPGQPCPSATRNPAQALCFVNDNFAQIYLSKWNGISFYSGLQASLTKKMSNGLQVQANYTWSKSIDTNSLAFSSGGTLTGIANPYPLIPKINKGPSDFNVPQNFVVNSLYHVPGPHGDSGITNALLKGWEVGGIFTASSGEPFSFLMLFDNPSAPFFGTGTGTHAFIGWVIGEKPDLINSPACKNPNQTVRTLSGDVHVATYGKLECFIGPSDPANAPGRAGHIGDFGRNRMHTPALVNFDFSLYKNNYVPRISESFNVQFRAEFFNVFNHTNLGFPLLGNMWMPSPNFGQAGYTATPSRQIQLGLKIIF